MVKFELANEDEVPQPIKAPTTKRMRVSHEIISSLKPGKVAVIQLGPSDTMKGTKASLTRAANRFGLAIDLWDRDGVVYVKLGDN